MAPSKHAKNEDKERSKAAAAFDLSVLRPEHLAGRPRRVGRIGRSPVLAATTTGGLSLIFVSKDGKTLDGIGAGSLPEVARWVAEKRNPGLVWEELQKSEPLPYEAFGHLVPKYEAYTDLLAEACRRVRR
jgi:hypothetical protein